MATYTHAPQPIRDLVAEVIREHASALHDAEVTVRVTEAHGRETRDGVKAPAILRDGHALLARCRPSSLEDRAAGVEDLLLTLDGDAWPNLPIETQRAAIHHALAHYAPVERAKDGGTDGEADDGEAAAADAEIESVADEGDYELDSSGRPKLRRVRPDAIVRWFDAVAEAHGRHACEVVAATAVIERSRQLSLPLVGVVRRKKDAA